MTESNSMTKSERDALGKRVNLTANDVASPPTQEKGKTKLEAVENWLRATLANGPLLCETIEKDAKGLGISVGTLRRAKKSLGVKSKKRIYQGEWEWFVPTHPGAKDRQGEKTAQDDASHRAPSERPCALLTEPAPDKASPKDAHCAPLNESKQNTISTTDVVSTPKYTRRRSLTSAGR
jgi:hypothetical protein